ncbi:hypothetical protein RCH33_1634 [Flavobacterium daejeonense]|nr:hypothetical protein RCH33_1634 [Flavobacterium daejeonense]
MEMAYKKLFLGILFDAIGMLSFSIPFVGEFSDVVWAPLSGFLMTRMYKGKLGRIGGIISFAEEFLPYIDFIPTFTLSWIYYYKFKKKD